MNNPQIYRHPGTFVLEQGGSIEGLEIAYHIYGKPDAKCSNVVWVCHALTANSEVADWWPHTVEAGGFLDPEKYCIVCANILGSCYGTTGPLSVNPSTGHCYYEDFPAVTIADMVRAHQLLADYLGFGCIHALVGSSVGGFQAVEWAIQEPLRIGTLALIATDACATPWALAIDEAQRMAIRADATFGAHTPDAGAAGLAAARAIGMLTYRGRSGYNATQRDIESSDGIPTMHRACTYQRHQGQKLVQRFNAYSYISILDAFDTHDVGRGRGGVKAALKRITAPTIVVGITSDNIFPPEDMQRLAADIPNAVYRQIDSPMGHDGFLVEHAQLNAILTQFI